MTRGIVKPAPLRISSRTPSGPAAARVTEGQRKRSRAMERASVIPPLNMRPRRWASAVRDKFQFALLVPARDRLSAGRDRRQRVGPEPVRSARPLQESHLDKAPDIKNE